MSSIWQNLRGRQTQIEMFRRAVGRGRVSHAYIFVGPAGTGKRRVARGIAQSLFCPKVANEQLDACGACSSCKQVLAGTHPDLLSVACPEGKRELPISLILGDEAHRGREGLCHDLSLRPMSAERRVAIIDDADLMNEASANALLKTLEEPPEGSILFLLTPDLDLLLPTIRSRCQPIMFPALTKTEIAELLLELGWSTDPAEAQQIAALSEGGLETARKLLESGLRQHRETLYRCLAKVPFDSTSTTATLLAALEELGGDVPQQREHARWLIRFAVDFYRRLLLRLESPVAITATEEDRLIQAVIDRAQTSVTKCADHWVSQLNRCLDAEEHLDGIMPVPLCIEGWCYDLGRIARS